MTLTEKAQSVFAADRYATELTGVEITNVGTHEAVCTLTINDRHRNARGVVMGGALFTLADICAAVAANSDTLERLQWVSLDSNIHFLAPATDGILSAHCTALKIGRATSLYQTLIESPDSSKNAPHGHMVAIVETNMIRI